jgi:hypothetical protein
MGCGPGDDCLLTLAVVSVNRAVGTGDARRKVADIGGADIGHKDAVVLQSERASGQGSQTMIRHSRREGRYGR